MRPVPVCCRRDEREVDQPSRSGGHRTYRCLQHEQAEQKNDCRGDLHHGAMLARRDASTPLDGKSVGRASNGRHGISFAHGAARGWRRTGRPARAAGASHVMDAFGAEHGWGCPATGPAIGDLSNGVANDYRARANPTTTSHENRTNR